MSDIQFPIGSTVEWTSHLKAYRGEVTDIHGGDTRVIRVEQFGKFYCYIKRADELTLAPLTPRDLLIAQCVVSFARASQYQSDLDFLESILLPTRETREAIEDKRVSRDMAVLTLWKSLKPLIDTPGFWEKVK